MGVKPRLEKLRQGRQMVSRDERNVLGIEPRRYALVREIKMGKAHENWLYARTVIPNETLRGQAKRIASLNDTPIGKILFSRNGAHRESLSVQRTVNLPQPVTDLLETSAPFPLWVRRSIFRFDDKPLLITETFLPDCPIYRF